MQVFNAFGNTYRGTLKKSMVAGDWKGRNYIRTYVKPRNPKTTKQVENRGFYVEAVVAWSELLTLGKIAYKHMADFQKRNLSGYNTQIGNYMAKRLIAEPVVEPSVGTIEIVVEITLDPIEGARYEVKRHDGTAVYCSGTSDESGFISDGLTEEDENYDLFVYAPLMYPYEDLDLPADELFGVHATIEMAPVM